jgi:hypothetical protein
MMNTRSARPPKTPQEEARSKTRHTKVAKGGELALAAFEIYCKVYLAAALKRRHIASALHEQLAPFDSTYGDLRKFVGRYEYYYYRGIREKKVNEVMIGESMKQYRVRWFTTMVDEVSDVLLRNRLPTFPTKKHDLFDDLYSPGYVLTRMEFLRKGSYRWSSYECLLPERGSKPIRRKVRLGGRYYFEYDRLWTI